MRSAATTRIENNALEAYRKRRTPEVRAINDQAAEIIEKVEIDLCPKSSIEHVHLFETIKRERIDENAQQVSVGDAEHDYADVLEHGGEHTEAQPFHRPAAQEGRRWMNGRYKEIK
jgi:HK97 gp10 family phage protein